MPWPPPPGVPQGPSSPYGAAEPPLSDTVERMLRPQGLFQNMQPRPFDWEQAYAPAQAPQPGAGQPASGPPPPGPPPPDGSGYQAPGQYGQPPHPGGDYRAPDYGATEWGATQYGGQYATTDLAAAQYQQGQFGQGQIGQGQIGQGQIGQAQYPPGQYPPGQYPPGGQYGPGGAFGPGGQFGPGMPPAAGSQRQLAFGKVRLNLPKGPLVPAAVAVLLVVVIAAAVVLVAKNGSSSGSGSGSGTSAGSTPTTSSSASAIAEKQAATQLAGLLAQSGNDRSDVVAADVNVNACKDLAASAREFAKAATNRQTLLTKLAQLPGGSALPPALLTDIKGAWQASATVDEDLAKWASKAATSGCHKGNSKDPNSNSKDPNLNASFTYDGIADNDKTAFVKLWNPLARADGLPTYTVDQL
jgi:hypothetical protein